MKRLFAFGCSFTYYGAMLTYPWFLAKNFDETYNLGSPGCGNEYIFHSLIDADTRLKLTQDDTVIMCWTGPFRLDMPRPTHIDPAGNALWEGNGDWTHYQGNRKQLKEFYTHDFMLQKTFNYMAMAKRYLEAKNIKYRFSSLDDFRMDREILKEIYDDNFVEPTGLVPYVAEYNNTRMRKKEPVFSGHPSFSTHYKFAQNFAKSLNMTLPNEVDEWFTLEENIYLEQNVYDRYDEIKSHPLYSQVYENYVQKWRHNESHIVFPSCFKFNQNSSNLYKQILLDIFA